MTLSGSRRKIGGGAAHSVQILNHEIHQKNTKTRRINPEQVISSFDIGTGPPANIGAKRYGTCDINVAAKTMPGRMTPPASRGLCDARCKIQARRHAERAYYYCGIFMRGGAGRRDAYSAGFGYRDSDGAGTRHRMEPMKRQRAGEPVGGMGSDHNASRRYE